MFPRMKSKYLLLYRKSKIHQHIYIYIYIYIYTYIFTHLYIIQYYIGIGWATTSVVFLVNCFYNVILTWAIYYFFASFTSKLPWTTCDNEWNTDICRLSFNSSVTRRIGVNTTSTSTFGDTTTDVASVTTATPTVFIDPTVEFWELVL